jgi:hypothetical protein
MISTIYLHMLVPIVVFMRLTVLLSVELKIVTSGFVMERE